MEFLIKLNDIKDINILLPLLSRLGISFTEKTKKTEPNKTQIPITYAAKPDFMSLAGIWKGKNIDSTKPFYASQSTKKKPPKLKLPQ